MNRREQNELIDAMAEAAYEDARDRWAIKLGPTWADLDEKTKNWHRADAKAVIRAANERGFDLCRLPERVESQPHQNEFRQCLNDGYNACLDAEWMVSPSWTTSNERDEVIERARALLAELEQEKE